MQKRETMAMYHCSTPSADLGIRNNLFIVIFVRYGKITLSFDGHSTPPHSNLESEFDTLLTFDHLIHSSLVLEQTGTAFHAGANFQCAGTVTFYLWFPLAL